MEVGDGLDIYLSFPVTIPSQHSWHGGCSLVRRLEGCERRAKKQSHVQDNHGSDDSSGRVERACAGVQGRLGRAVERLRQYTGVRFRCDRTRPGQDGLGRVPSHGSWCSARRRGRRRPGTTIGRGGGQPRLQKTVHRNCRKPGRSVYFMLTLDSSAQTVLGSHWETPRT